jgi:Domain of unknown function (DUF3846)
MAKIYYANGESKEVQPANGTNFTLKEAQAIVGGLVEVVRLPDEQYVMLINEESKLIDLPRNAEATKIASLPTAQERRSARLVWEEMGYSVIDTLDSDEEDYIAGDVLVCKDDEFR